MPSVLIVDDEKHTREGLQQALQENYDVSVAGSTDEAFNLMEAQEFNVILTDLRMPGKSGLKVIDRALTLPNKPAVLMMTAYGNVESAVEAMKRGAVDFLTKPVNIERLEVLIQRALKSRTLEAEVQQLHERLELAERDKRNAVELAQTRAASEMQKAAMARDAEIRELKARLDAGEVARELAVKQALGNIETERNRLPCMDHPKRDAGNKALVSKHAHIVAVVFSRSPEADPEIGRYVEEASGSKSCRCGSRAARADKVWTTFVRTVRPDPCRATVFLVDVARSQEDEIAVLRIARKIMVFIAPWLLVANGICLACGEADRKSVV